jgi:hypothetical protein
LKKPPSVLALNLNMIPGASTVQTLVRVRVRPRVAKEAHGRTCLKVSDEHSKDEGSNIAFLGPPEGSAASYDFDRVYGR